MSETTWIIEPHGWGWVLLVVATASLSAIAIRLWTQKHTTQQSSITPNRGSVVAWVALVLAIISCTCAFFRPTDLNNASILITALGVLVTLLVTWNIWQVLDIKDTVRKAEEASKRIDELSSLVESTKSSYQSYVFYVDAVTNFNKGNYSRAFMDMASSLETAIECEISFSRFGRRALDLMDDCLDKGQSNIGNSPDMHIEMVEMLLRQVSKSTDYLNLATSRLHNMKSRLEAMRN